MADASQELAKTLSYPPTTYPPYWCPPSSLWPPKEEGAKFRWDAFYRRHKAVLLKPSIEEEEEED